MRITWDGQWDDEVNEVLPTMLTDVTLNQTVSQNDSRRVQVLQGVF